MFPSYDVVVCMKAKVCGLTDSVDIFPPMLQFFSHVTDYVTGLLHFFLLSNSSSL